MSESIRHPLSFYESTGEIELGRGDVISTIDLASFPGSYPVYSSSAVGLGEFGRYGRYMFYEELITWSIDGGGRPFHRKKHRFSVTNVCGFLRIKRPDLWDYRYLHALLEKLQSGIQFDYQMKAHPSVIRELYQFERMPIVEQRKIGQILSTLDTAIRETETLIDKLKAVKQGLLHDLLTRGIDANGQLRPPQSEAPQLYKESPLGWIPRAWEVLQLGSCADIASGVTLGRSLNSPVAIELPYLRVANVQDGYLELREIKTVSILPSELNRFALKVGDVLMNEGGDFDKLGRGAVWEGQIEPCLHQNHVFRVRCDDSKLLPAFLAAYSSSVRGKSYFVQASKQTTNLASINSTQLKAFGITCPPVAEQLLIAQRLSTLDKKMAVEQEVLEKLRQQKSGLMDDLLTGRVRVTPLLETVQQAAAQTGA